MNCFEILGLISGKNVCRIILAHKRIFWTSSCIFVNLALYIGSAFKLHYAGRFRRQQFSFKNASFKFETYEE